MLSNYEFVVDTDDMSSSKILGDSAGSHYYTEQCRSSVLQLPQLLEPIEVHRVRYVVAFRQNDYIRMVGLSEDWEAQAVYNAVPLLSPKILFDRKSSPTEVGFEVCKMLSY